MTKHLSIVDGIEKVDKDTMEKYLYPLKFENINILRNHYFWDVIMKNSSSKDLCDYLKEYFRIKNKLLVTL